MESNMVLGMIYKQTATIKDAQILAFGPPMIPGFSMNNGISMTLQDKTGGDLNKFFEITKGYLAELNKRPEIQNAMTSYNPNYPQYMVDVDVAKTKQEGTSPAAVLSTLQGYYGGMYASNFNAYGKLFRVMIQGDVASRMRPDGLSNIYVRLNSGDMAPVSEFVKLRRVYGPSNIGRFNLFTAINLNITPSTEYSSGDALKAVEEVAADYLPDGYGYEYSGLTRSEPSRATLPHSSSSCVWCSCTSF
jgi:HAE1 family hydrophobic/amphiphilic exporter-1